MVTLQLTLPDAVYRKVRELAENEGAEIAAFIAALIADKALSRPEKNLPFKKNNEKDLDKIGSSSKGPRSNISVVLNWQLINRGNQEKIRENTAAATMARLMERLARSLGEKILDKLTGFRISRGPIVSRTPDRDFINKKTGDTYAHHKIPNTSYYVLTHSETDQKVKDLKSIAKFLGYPATFLQIDKHGKG